MGKQSNHKSSRSSDNRDRRRLMEGVIEFFDFHRLFHLRRLLMGRRHRRGGDTSGPKYLKAKQDGPSSGVQHEVIDVQGEIKYANDKNEVYDELRRVSALPKEMTRTLSIHHLECNDYVIESGNNRSYEQSDLTRSLNNVANRVHNQNDDSSYQLVKEPSLFQKNDKESNASFVEQQKTPHKNQNEFLTENQTNDPFGALELYNAGKEIFKKILQDEDRILANRNENFQNSDPALVLTRSGTYPKFGTSCNTMNVSKHKPILDDTNPSISRGKKSQASIPKPSMEGQNVSIGPDVRSVDYDMDTSNSKFSSVAFHNWKTQTIDGIDNEDKKEKYRISMDSVFHKLPYGKKLPQKMRIEKSGFADRLTPTLKKSRSLTESMDRYSFLLDHNFSKESDSHVFQRSKSAREGGPFPAISRSRTLGHGHSLQEFEPYFSRKDPLFDKSDVMRSSKQSPLNPKRIDPAIIHDKEEGERCDVLDDVLPPNVVEEPITLSTKSNEHRQLEYSERTPEDRNAYKPLQGQDIRPECCHRDEEISPGQESDVKSQLQDNLNGIESYFSHEENAEKIPDCNASKQTNSQDVNKRLHPLRSAYDSMYVQIDSKDEAEFNFVRELLNKSGFSSNELSKAWNSAEQPVDFSLFEEVEGSKCRLDFGLYAPDINLDHLLLFDLINEVLLETYSSSLNPWLSCFNPGNRRITIGSRILEEVWAKICWHRSYQSEPNPSFEYIVDRDISRNDGWMDVRYETEYLGQELAALILDNLLDEAILQQYK